MRPAKIILFAIIATLLLIGLYLLANLALSGLFILAMSIFGVDLETALGGWGGTILLLAILYMFPKHLLVLNREYECHGSEVIDAPASEVWDRVRIRERDDYFTSATKRIRRIPGSDDEFIMLFDDRLQDEETPNHVHIKMIDEVPGEYIAFQTLNADEMPSFGKDHLMTEILLSQEPDGVKVTYIESLSRITLASFLAFLFLNPAKDAMSSLKAQIEGTENPSTLTRWVEGMGPDGEPSGEVKRAIWIGGSTAVLLTTILAAASILLVVWHTTGS